jgi:aspartyl-tRNA(Asn)/glutamyl-tRNA(Gln) amidotransferase subunit C
MSTITTEQIKKLATLSRLSFDDSQLAEFSKGFENVLALASQISKANTAGVPPLTTTIVADDGKAPSTPERADAVTEPAAEAALARRAALQSSSPATEMGFFVVPKIVE